MQLDLSSVLLQWAVGGLLGLWITGRHRLVGVRYGWLLRSVFGVMAIGAIWAGVAESATGVGATVRAVGASAMVVCVGVALVVSIVRRSEPARIPPALDLLAPVAGFVA
ncbi:MAG: hypothetical protein MUP97_15285, partial [Acidimicrobiia bacterium]|nr:hypothetical protein [Acidimicrobiia bacterium]